MTRVSSLGVTKPINPEQLAIELSAIVGHDCYVLTNPGNLEDVLTNGVSKDVYGDDYDVNVITSGNLTTAITAHTANIFVPDDAREMPFYIGGPLQTFTRACVWTNYTGVSQTIIRVGVRTDVSGAPTGSAITTAIKVDGTSATTAVQIAAGAEVGGPFVTAVVVPAGSVLTLDITGIGTTLPGTGFDVQMYRVAR